MQPAYPVVCCAELGCPPFHLVTMSKAGWNRSMFPLAERARGGPERMGQAQGPDGLPQNSHWFVRRQLFGTLRTDGF